MATTSFPSSRWNGMIQLPLLLMPPLGTWFNSCYLPSSNCKNMVQLLLHPMLALLLSVWFNSCYIPYLLVYLQHGSTLVTSHAKSFILGMVQLLLHPMPHLQSTFTSFPIQNHTIICICLICMSQPHGCITPVHDCYKTIKMLLIHTHAQRIQHVSFSISYSHSTLAKALTCQTSFHHLSSLANHF